MIIWLNPPPPPQLSTWFMNDPLRWREPIYKITFKTSEPCHQNLAAPTHMYWYFGLTGQMRVFTVHPYPSERTVTGRQYSRIPDNAETG